MQLEIYQQETQKLSEKHRKVLVEIRSQIEKNNEALLDRRASDASFASNNHRKCNREGATYFKITQQKSAC